MFGASRPKQPSSLGTVDVLRCACVFLGVHTFDNLVSTALALSPPVLPLRWR